MAALQCEDCKKMYGSGDGEGGHCVSCHQSFASNTSFDAHILRTVIGRPHLQVAVAGEPWRQNRKGYWTNEPEREWTGPGSDSVAEVVSADAAE